LSVSAPLFSPFSSPGQTHAPGMPGTSLGVTHLLSPRPKVLLTTLLPLTSTKYSARRRPAPRPSG
jgi:hypothetical protein